MRGRLSLLVLLVLAAACSRSRAREPFDPGHTVHFIVHAAPAPRAPLESAPICTVGTHVARCRPVRIEPGGVAGVEAGTLRVPSADYSLSIYDASSGAHASAPASIRRETWVVLQIDPSSGRSRLGIFEVPPHGAIGAYRPFVPVPD
ncbi:MAG: hypothetical protein ACT4PV_08355 [Planctomycetaceae bacterium]